MKIRTKTVIGVALIEAVLAAVLLVLMLGYISDTSYKAVETRAQSTAALFASSVKDAVIAFDLATLETVANEVMQQDDVVYARVTDSSSRVLVEVGQFGGANFEEPASRSKDGIYDHNAMIRIDGEVFGEVQVGISSASTPLLIADARRWGLTVAGVEMFLVASFSLLLGVYLTRKLGSLALSAKRMAQGDLQTPIRTDGNDEVDALAHSLETMRKELAKSHMQLSEANASLETRVNERTAALSSSKAEIEESRKREAHVFAIVGHEMRTPLAAAQMMLSSDSAQLDMSLLRETIEHTLDLVDDMSLLAGNKVSAEHSQYIDICEQTKTTLRSVESWVEDAGFKLHFNSCDYAARVRLSPKYLRQILLNLVKNAVRHSEGQNIWVATEVESVDDASAVINISVVDDGVGVAPQDRKRIFSAFERGLSKSEGTGIGLSVIREIVDSLNGEIEVATPASGRGAKFYVALTLGTDPNPTPSKNMAQGEFNFDGLKVLVAEDNKVIQMLTREMLIKQGAEVVLADDGQAATEQFDASIDLVLTDIMMPRMNGYELTAWLRAEGFKGPVIGVTAATVGAEREQLLAAGVDSALPKPLTISSLSNVLGKRAC